jgi:hypothetical protein
MNFLNELFVHIFLFFKAILITITGLIELFIGNLIMTFVISSMLTLLSSVIGTTTYNPHATTLNMNTIAWIFADISIICGILLLIWLIKWIITVAISHMYNTFTTNLKRLHQERTSDDFIQ